MSVRCSIVCRDGIHFYMNSNDCFLVINSPDGQETYFTLEETKLLKDYLDDVLMVHGDSTEEQYQKVIDYWK